MNTWVVFKDNFHSLKTGEVRNTHEFLEVFSFQPGGYLSGVNLFWQLAPYKGLTGINLRVSARRRRAYDRNGKLGIIGEFYVDYISFKGHRSPTRKWEVLNLELFKTPVPESLSEQIEMTQELLDLADARGVTMKRTRGSFAMSLLKASPYWNSKTRRPAPQFINDETRKHLPGNHYSVSTRLGTRHLPHCYYIDQTAAHHHIVNTEKIPNPLQIRARGNYREALKGNGPPWVKAGTDTYRALLAEHSGLFLCRTYLKTIPSSIRHLYPHAWTEKTGSQLLWIWSPEFKLLEGRVQIEHIVCAFTSTKDDKALTEYAGFSLDYIQQNQPKHIKSVLHSAYGMLAFNPVGSKIYRYWSDSKHKKQVVLPMMGKMNESVYEYPDFVQSTATNVIARGVIEAETKVRSLLYARELTKQGFHVPQIYADGLLLETDSPPFTPPGWRITHSLTNVSCPHPNYLCSDQLVKLPGVPARARGSEWVQKMIRAGDKIAA